jgi:hypothetical protein
MSKNITPIKIPSRQKEQVAKMFDTISEITII